MTTPKFPPAEDIDISELKTLASGFLESLLPAPWGQISTIVLSQFDKLPIQYFIPQAPKSQAVGVNQPSFAVIGMGRCGAHVAAALHRMVNVKRPNPNAGNQPNQYFVDWAAKLFPPSRQLAFKPIMLVGDTDDQTFNDIRGLTKDDGSASPQAVHPVLELSFKPLAKAGVGHNPVIAQFFTRALLMAPDASVQGHPYGWLNAKQFLLSLDNPNTGQPPRLAFYIFAAGGGTGCGAAAEILRAQQFASVAARGSSLTFYAGVAVFPEASSTERTRILNCGRFMVQYLADQKIVLNEEPDYRDVPKFQGSTLITQIQVDGDKLALAEGRTPVVSTSWNCVLVISNEIMKGALDQSLEKVIELSNQYIAQQLFNLAGPQVSAQALQVDDSKLPRKNFEAIRLDPFDLLVSLRGPCACCFAASTVKEKEEEKNSKDWIQKLFLRSLSIPTLRDETGLIEGISISPVSSDNKKSYSETLLLSDESADQKLDILSSIPVFDRCGSVVFTITAPQQGSILSAELDELMRLCEILFPNLKVTRYSAIYGTTDFYTLSLYIEGSVIFAPEVERSVKNYLRMCWPLARRMTSEAFSDWWTSALSPYPKGYIRLPKDGVLEKLGRVEKLEGEYPNLDQAKRVAIGSWEACIAQMDATDQEQLRHRPLRFEEMSISHKEIDSAIAFYNYFKNRSNLELID